MLSSSFALASRSGSGPTPELTRGAVEACRVVLHEVRRRVDASITNAAVKAELRQGIKVAEASLTTAVEHLTSAATHRSVSSGSAASAHPTAAAALPMSSVETQAHVHGSRPSAPTVVHHVKGARSQGTATASPHGHSHSQHPHQNPYLPHPSTPAGAPTPTPPASPPTPPLPTKEDTVTRPTTTATAPTQSGTSAAWSPTRQSSSTAGSGEDDGTRMEKPLSNSSLGGSGNGGGPRIPVPARPTDATQAHPLFCTAAQSAAVWGYVLSAVYWKRRKLTEYAVTALELLLRVMPAPTDLVVTLLVDPAALTADGGAGGRGRRPQRRTGRQTLLAPTAVYSVLTECLLQSFSEPALQIRALNILFELLRASELATAQACKGSGAGRSTEEGLDAAATFFRGHVAIRVVEACFSVVTDGTQDGVRHEARMVLRAAVQRVVRAFVTMRVSDSAATAEAPPGAEGGVAGVHAPFSTDTILTDYTVDVDHSEPYTWIHVVSSDAAAAAASSSSPTAAAGALRARGFPLVASTAAGAGATRAAAAGDAPGVSSSTTTVVPLLQPSVQVQWQADAFNGNAAAAAATDAAAEALTPFAASRSAAAAAGPPAALMALLRPTEGDASGGPHEEHAEHEGRLWQEAGDGSSPLRSHNGVGGSGNLAATNASPVNLSFDPHTFFRSSVDESLVQEALSTLNTQDGALPSALKDLLMILRRMARCAARPCTGVPNESNPEVRARDLALWVLESVLDWLPVCNCEQEHRCATWMSLVLHACKYELLGSIAKNLAMAAPFALFERALHLLCMLLRKVHYHMARELHTLLGAFLVPLMGSQYATFRQKHAVLSMVRQLFAVPHLCVSFFVNYDCNPAFDSGAEYGGMLELLVEHVVETTFLDHVDESGEAYPWLSSDQQQLLRSESVVVMHTLVSSMYRWIAEDPQAYAQSLRRVAQRDAQRRQLQQGGLGALDAAESAELYLDNWDAADEHMSAYAPSVEGGGSSGGSAVNGRAGEEGTSTLAGGGNVPLVLDTASGVAIPHWSKHHNIEYHWKHVHYLLHDKRIAQEAVQRINAGRWKEAKALLESRGFMAAASPSEEERTNAASVAPGSSSYALFARFLFEYPGISRDAISGIFEKVNHKDGTSRLVLQEYLHCFPYADVPVDVAMRDTTCKFMSWDRPMFEAKVWETIQQCFGNEYARQNPSSITARDADTMAGVLLFLHSNLHNRVVKNDRMPASQFVRDANACLEFPMVEEDLQAMFERVLSRKWELDMYGRTPQQAEKERTLVRLSAKIQRERAAQWRRQAASCANHAHGNFTDSSIATAGACATAGDGNVAPSEDAQPGTEDGELDSRQSSFATTLGAGAGAAAVASAANAAAAPTTAAAPNQNASMDGSQLQVWLSNDVALLDNTIPAYIDGKDALKTKDEQLQAYHEVAAIHLHKLESVHRLYCIEGEAYRPQPYIVPYYAEHVRQMLLLTYPHVMASVFMGFRILEEAPIARKLLDTVQVTFDIAAAFVLNLRDLRPAVEEVRQRYLDDERAYQLLPPSRATFVPYLLNIL